MRVRCKKCQAEYNVDDSRIPPQGVTITCPKCLESFIVQQGDSGLGAVPLPGGAGAPPPGGAVPLPGGSAQPPGGAVPLPGGAAQPPGGAVPLPGGAAQPPGGAVPLPGGAAQPPGGAVPLPGGQAGGGLGGLFDDIGAGPPQAAPTPRSAGMDDVLADVDRGATPPIDSVPSHPFHGDSAIAKSSQAGGGLLDFIDQQAPAAPSSQQKSYKIRRRSGRVFGPYDESTILQMLQKQELAGNEDASTDGESWIAIGRIAIFAEEIQALMAAALGSLGALPAKPGGQLGAASDADLPGLPGTDLPGLVGQGGSGADLPGLPRADLPGLPGHGGTDLPGLPGADLPGLPGTDLPGIPGTDLPQPYSPAMQAGVPGGAGQAGGDLMAELGMSFSDPDAMAAAELGATPLDPADPLGADLSVPTEERVKRRAGPTLRGQRRQERRSRLVSLMIVVVIPLLVITAGGVFLGLVTGHGFFGYKWMMAKLQPPTEAPPPPIDTTPPEVPVADVPLEQLLARDSYVAYVQASKILGKVSGSSPEKALELAWVYARLALLDRDITGVAAGRAALRDAGELGTKPLGKAIKAIFEIVDGNCHSALKLLLPKVGAPPPKKSKSEESESLAVAGLALACSEKAQATEAEAYVDSALIANPINTFAMWCQAQLARDRGDFPTAAGYYEKILEVSANNARAALLLGEVLTATKGQSSEAQGAFSVALKHGDKALAPWQHGRVHLGLARLNARKYAF